MVELCILEMASSSLRSLTWLPEVVALGRNEHQPRGNVPLAIDQGENIIWHEEE